MKDHGSFKASRLIAFMLALVMLLCAVPSSADAAASKFSYSDAQDARQKALECFKICAFSAEYNSPSNPLRRWEKTIFVYLGGNVTKDDRNEMNKFIMELATHCPNMPNIRLVQKPENADIQIWYCPLKEMPNYVPDYVDGNWGFFRYWNDGLNKMTSARIAIASDKNNAASKRHLLREELIGAFGLSSDHYLYSDSILYGEWTTVGQLSDVDWLMLNMLYDPDLKCGMSMDEACRILQTKINK